MTTELRSQKGNSEVTATAKPQKAPLISRTGKTKVREDVIRIEAGSIQRELDPQRGLPEELGTRDTATGKWLGREL